MSAPISRPFSKPQVEVADIFRLFGEEYRKNHCLPLSTSRIMWEIEHCRTSELGGHLRQCDACDHRHNEYNSCCNRHCPKCQALAKARWLEARKTELLPVGYFHNVFTIPHEFNPLVLRNKKVLFNPTTIVKVDRSANRPRSSFYGATSMPCGFFSEPT